MMKVRGSDPTRGWNDPRVRREEPYEDSVDHKKGEVRAQDDLCARS